MAVNKGIPGTETQESAIQAGSGNDDLLLRFDHGIIDHLGLRLYQNRPTNVIAELVSNSWDAEASNVWVDLHQEADEPWFGVADDGIGMSRKDLRERYLVIGLPKRNAPSQTSPNIGRYLMGRKGIGKLAPFGIAGRIDVASAARDQDGNVLVNWIRIDVDRVSHSNSGEYPPVSVAKNCPLDMVAGIIDDATVKIVGFLERIASSTGTGTFILMRGLTLKRVLAPKDVIASMGSRFTVTLLRPDFKVRVNEVVIDEKSALPEFFHRIPSEGAEETSLPNGRPIRYWVGFVRNAAWTSDEAGVGVYAHGKIAQDRPFVFGLKGREIYTRYMYGVIEADWLDELPEDVISTDRTTIDWQHSDTMPLHEWGEAKLRKWIEEYRKKRAETEQNEVKQSIKASMAQEEIPRFRDWETDQIAEMVAKVTPALPTGDEGKKASLELIKAVADAWSHRPARAIIKTLWDRISDPDIDNGIAFAKVVDDLREHSIPEFLSLGVTFSQRAYALSLMWDMIHRSREIDLQHLIETFPWIIEPEDQLLTANQQLKTVIDKLAGEIDDRYIGHDVRAMLEEREDSGIPKEWKPDFVFLSDSQRRDIKVVELKSPRHPLQMSNYKQLSDYMYLIRHKYPQSKCSGLLIGSKQHELDERDTLIEVRDWQEQFNVSRRSYVDMLAAMIKTAGPDPDDPRLALMKEFGGEKVWALLGRISKTDEDLDDLITRFEMKYPLKPVVAKNA